MERMNVLVIGVALVVVVALAAVAFTFGPGLAARAVFGGNDHAGVNCDDFEFDPKSWRDEEEDGGTDGAEKQAAGLVKSRVLVGLSRSEVRSMLGSPSPNKQRDKWTYSAGWVNDGIGPGDGQLLIVQFDRAGTVTNRTSLLYPAAT